jgi:hypothetical protein
MATAVTAFAVAIYAIAGIFHIGISHAPRQTLGRRNDADIVFRQTRRLKFVDHHAGLRTIHIKAGKSYHHDGTFACDT